MLRRLLGAIFEAVADAVETVVNAVTEAVADVVETVGNLISDGLTAIGNALSNIPIIGGALRWVFSWLGNVVSAITDLAASVIKAVGSIIGGVLAAVIGIVGGILSLNGATILEGLKDLISSVIFGPIVLVLGKLVAAVQTIIPVQGRSRRLTVGEEALLRTLYRNGISYHPIRIVSGFAGLFAVTEPPFVLGNTIYLKGAVVDPTVAGSDPLILVHECIHVWQYQHEGAGYLGNAVGAQIFLPNFDREWWNEIGAGLIRWVDFNKEAQAWFIEDVYRLGTLVGTPLPPVPARGDFFLANGTTNSGFFEHTIPTTTTHVDRTNIANDAVTRLRGLLSFRLSQWL